LDGYKNILVKALYSPASASFIVRDPYLIFSEIKEMARAIIGGDFKPNLRRMIEEWIEDPVKPEIRSPC